MPVKVQNMNDKVEQADKYTVSLYFGDEKVAEAETKDIAVDATEEFSFSYTPTLAGEYNVYAVFSADDFNVTSEAVTVKVKGEDEEADDFFQLCTHRRPGGPEGHGQG